MTALLIVLLAGVAAGALNSVGGGGSFVAFPALVAIGVSAVTANAATTVALLPGGLASLWVYRHDLRPLPSTSIRALTTTSVVGGALGAGLLLLLPSESFDAVVPWLLAFATFVLAFGRRITSALRTRVAGRPAIVAGQLLLSLYGGYFGGASGLMMVAFWSVAASVDPGRLNPLRQAQMAAIYLTAGAVFLVASDVLTEWPKVLVMLSGAIIGGYGGASIGRRLSTSVLRAIVVTSAAAMTVGYFVIAS
ncbi:sulfite exporter TauE/SafE family protein [Kribbella sp. CA-293567]|uniref:sulfite exporter TauE/SafE family protein n=1 Tax=Kribbella sp. CA-293567 TaxID=3002436 RepID=UPI0022DE92BF|nr:sulfite exporter TauE/SafE family protein [Kribbella sp. CA-293567]WBQ04120.1 sulfite exporter TauE/SafE family protein [Kribbella sp. CA-293567]